MSLNKNSKIFIAGHNGMVGSAILRVFKKKNYKRIYIKDRSNLDLLSQEKETISVDGVNGPDLVLGSLTDVSTSGNWPTTFDVETK